ncbi:MAG: universal stress protein [Armatimonadota bacterium]|jgi:nucleotide-binding universal stress UspA family protein
MIRTIIVPLEGTPASDVALRCAVRLARWHDARVVMLASAQAEALPETASAYADAEFEDGEEAEDEELELEPGVSVADHPLVDAAAALCGRHRVAWRAEGCAGDPTGHLAHYAPRADVVTVSRRGSRAVRRELPRHAFAILRASVRAVLLTPETYQEPQVILAPYDRSAPAARALSLAAETSVRAELPLTVVSVGGDAFTAASLAEARRYLAAYSGQTEFVRREGDPVQQLTALTFELPGALLVMAGYGRPPVRRLLGGSRTERILAGCHGPALIVR